MQKDLKILAIETSCDDTGIAIVKASQKKPDFNIFSNIVSSQIEIHKKWGGVYPAMAKREHQKNLIPTLKEALRQSNLLETSNSQFSTLKKQTISSILEREPNLLKQILPFLKKYQKPDIDFIAVTVGPGLEPCLWVGVNLAKSLAYYWNLPIIEVNHVEAHILANFISETNQTQKNKNMFPAVCLVVSGGHTQLILMEDFGKYKILGETRDDAAGECFDKTARILGLGYPGGPIVAAKAKQDRGQTPILLPRPMINTKDYDFSFSGLKTAVLYKVKNERLKTKSEKYIQAMCQEIQQAVIDVLIKKTIKAAKDFKVKTIILGGGVVANEELRKQFLSSIKCKMPNVNFLVPPKNLCTDNALMVAIAGHFRWKQGKIEKWRDIEANANLRVE